MTYTTKFRVWDSFNEEYIYSEKRGLCKFFADVNLLAANDNNPIVEQCIDMKDKEGVDIYEGDKLFRVFVGLNTMYYNYKVFRVDGGFAINQHQSDFNKDAKDILWYESTSDMQNKSFITNSLTVYGNVHVQEPLEKIFEK